MKQPKVFGHGSYIGTTGYSNHTRDFFRGISNHLPIKTRNFTVGKSWKGLSDEPHNEEKYLTEKDKKILHMQTTFNPNGGLEDHFIYSNYEQNCNGYKLDKAHFWTNFNKHCVGKTMDIQLKQFNDSPRKRYIVIETIDKYREIFNELQDYNYTYDTENYDDWD